MYVYIILQVCNIAEIFTTIQNNVPTTDQV